ncbi:hypothetical protein [Thermoanaerobacterium thermosaccharolyticum]|uniref:hypothetical protein n=1 Tax=Thermoanaerobacterium thermosaccharolyticum TaxID=1517 RepID=UPI0017819F3C|nr:hypothetical protein [Thermoanaerobacterium thermosaccharolyticum]MBE0069979.1 hypothetical protein [Thermoanaerobacterium thermosaccharolyticum]
MIDVSNQALIVLVKGNISEILHRRRFFAVLAISFLISLYKLSNIAIYTRLYKTTFNIYDLLLSNMSNFHEVMFALNFLFLFLIGNMFLHDNDSLRIIRCNSKDEWFIMNFLSIFTLALIFVVCIIIINVLIGCLNLDFQNLWSDGSKTISKELNKMPKEIISYMSPLTAVLISSLLLIFNFTILGTVFYIGIICFRKAYMGFITSSFIIIMSIAAKYMNLIKYTKYLLADNILLFNHNFRRANTLPTIPYSFIYLASIIVITYILGLFLFKRQDFDVGGNNNDY